MFLAIIPKLPMRNKRATTHFYVNQLGFELLGDYGNYILVKKEGIEIHFFEFVDLDPKQNYGQVYVRVRDIEQVYQALVDRTIPIHPNGHLETKPWGQKEFALLDPDHNLLTFGESISN